MTIRRTNLVGGGKSLFVSVLCLLFCGVFVKMVP